MSYHLVIKDIQQVLNECGDKVSLIPTGNNPPSQIKPGDLSIEVKPTVIQGVNNCFRIKTPSPINPTINHPEKYLITRVRISNKMIDDYSKRLSYSKEELIHVLENKDAMFGYFEPIINIYDPTREKK